MNDLIAAKIEIIEQRAELAATATQRRYNKLCAGWDMILAGYPSWAVRRALAMLG